jgi:hypothetical protein
MPLKDRKSGESLVSVIESVTASDFKRLKPSKEFNFNWNLEEKNEVYKIYLLEKPQEILGLMSLIDHPEEYRIHINLIEVGNENKGRLKKIDNTTGCLLAHACEIAYERGYYGFVSLQPKTKLIDLYQDRYGFRQFGRFLAVWQESAHLLMKKYL